MGSEMCIRDSSCPGKSQGILRVGSNIPQYSSQLHSKKLHGMVMLTAGCFCVFFFCCIHALADYRNSSVLLHQHPLRTEKEKYVNHTKENTKRETSDKHLETALLKYCLCLV